MEKETKKQKKEGMPGKKGKKQVKVSTIIFSFGLVLIFILVFFAVLIYVFNIQNGLTERAAAIIPYPAVLAGDSVITVGEVEKKLEGIKSFYEKQDFSEIGTRVDFKSADGKKRLKIKEKNLLEKMIEDRLVESEAKKRGIRLTREMISQEVKRKMDEYGSQRSLRDDLSRLYGWSVADFEENIVKPDMYKERLLEDLRRNDSSYAEARKKIEEAKRELDEKMDFQEAVKKYSEGESAKNKGDLGWFSADEMLLEISAVVFSLEKGQVSGIIESPLGYHIVRLEDRKKEDEIDKVKLSQVFVRTKSIGDWLDEYERKSKIRIFLKDFYWNTKDSRVDFSDKKMVEFQKETEKNSQGDISIMF